jgi:single-strand DNA-binding protein
MNKSILTGRLTRDPEVRYSQGEKATAIARWTLAVDRRFKKQGDDQTADFPSCVAFGKTAEFVEKYFYKGMKMNLIGRLQTGSYTNKEGIKVYTTDIIVEEVEFGESKAAAGEQHEPKPEPSLSELNDGFMNIPDGIDESLPFN